MEYAVVYLALYLFMAFVIYIASGLIGNMMLAKASRSAKEGNLRVTSASKSVAVLSDQVNGLSTNAALEKWAIANGYVMRDDTAKKVVASD